MRKVINQFQKNSLEDLKKIILKMHENMQFEKELRSKPYDHEVTGFNFSKLRTPQKLVNYIQQHINDNINDFQAFLQFHQSANDEDRKLLVIRNDNSQFNNEQVWQEILSIISSHIFLQKGDYKITLASDRQQKTILFENTSTTSKTVNYIKIGIPLFLSRMKEKAILLSVSDEFSGNIKSFLQNSPAKANPSRQKVTVDEFFNSSDEEDEDNDDDTSEDDQQLKLEEIDRWSLNLVALKKFRDFSLKQEPIFTNKSDLKIIGDCLSYVYDELFLALRPEMTIAAFLILGYSHYDNISQQISLEVCKIIACYHSYISDVSLDLTFSPDEIKFFTRPLELAKHRIFHTSVPKYFQEKLSPISDLSIENKKILIAISLKLYQEFQCNGLAENAFLDLLDENCLREKLNNDSIIKEIGDNVDDVNNSILIDGIYNKLKFTNESQKEDGIKNSIKSTIITTIAKEDNFIDQNLNHVVFN